MECLACNAVLKQNDKFCQVCGEKVALNSSKAKSKAKRIFELSKGEVEVKTYYCTTLEDPFAQGYICVTNKRLVYYAFGESSKQFNEVYIDKISGISSYYGTGRIPQYLSNAYSSGFGLIGCNAFKVDMSLTIMLVIGLIIRGLYNLYKYFYDKRVVYYFDILSEASSSPGISIGLYDASITGQGAAVSKNAVPTQQTHVMMRELGAMILDLKNLGDHAVEIWKEDTTTKEQENKEDFIKENIFK